MAPRYRRGSTQHGRRASSLGLVVCVALAAAACGLSHARAQDVSPNRSHLPLADPVIDANAELTGQSATSWRDGATRWVLLEGDVSLRVRTYHMRASKALVRIDTERRPGLVIRHLSAVLDQVEPGRNNGAVTVDASRLLVTVSTRGQVELSTSLLREPDGVQDPFVRESQQRIARYLALRSGATRPIPPGSMVDMADQKRLAQLRARAGGDPTVRVPDTTPPTPIPPIPPTPTPPVVPDGVRKADQDRILAPAGTVSFTADRVVFQKSQEEGEPNSVALVGHVRILYQDHRQGRHLALRAESAVIFVEGDELSALSSRQTGADAVKGIYLEENVIATDGEYTMRAPRVFYDLANDKAVVLDAVFYTFDSRRKIPLYVRAKKIRQETRQSWVAEDAKFTTSAFAEPHFAIATSQLEIKQDPSTDGGSPHYRFRAHDTTVRANNVPVFYWPELAGSSSDLPLRRLTAGYRSKDGAVIKTKWDAFALLGRTKPEGVDGTFDVDFLGDHGIALGFDLKYDRPQMFGRVEGYILPYDHEDDDIADRLDIDHDGDTRGFIHLQHRHLLRDNWELSVEAAYVSDETFLEEFFNERATEQRPYETSIYLKKQEEDWAFTFLAKTDLSDFTAQTPLLQAPGYSVDKMPEVGFYRVATPLLDDRLTWYSENRLSRMRINVGDDSPSERGFSAVQSMINFGIPTTTDFDDALRAAGVPTSSRLRLDSRQEIQAPLKLADIDVVPFAAGRVTAYDDNFEEFAGENDNLRLLGTVGVRFATQISKVDDDVEIPLLDVHRVRHIIEPTADISLTSSTYDPEDVPIYDADVEGLTEGAAFRVGLRNTWQTQRGGPGRWRNVDWLIIDTEYVHRSEDSDVTTPIPHFFAYRPEFSRGGDHFHANLLWQMSDNVAITGDVVYNLEDDLDGVATWHVGATLRHTDRLTSFIDYAEIDVLDSQLLTYGFTYELTRLYTVSLAHRIDVEQKLTRALDIIVTRRLPRWRFAVIVSFDDIDDEQSVGFVLIPDGISSGSVPTVANSLHRR